VLRSATVPFFYHKTNGTVALRSTSKHSGAYFRTRPLGIEKKEKEIMKEEITAVQYK